MVFGIVTLGLIHGLIFLPVFLAGKFVFSPIYKNKHRCQANCNEVYKFISGLIKGNKYLNTRGGSRDAAHATIATIITAMECKLITGTSFKVN